MIAKITLPTFIIHFLCFFISISLLANPIAEFNFGEMVSDSNSLQLPIKRGVQNFAQINSNKESSNEDTIQLLLELAEDFYERKQYKEVLSLFKKNRVSQNDMKSKYYIELLKLTGQVYIQLQERDSAFIYLKRAIAISNTIQEEIEIKSLISIYKITGDLYKKMGDYLNAQGYYYEALAMVKKDNSTTLLENEIELHCAIGECYKYLFKEEKAIENFNIALNLVPQLPKIKRRKSSIQIHEDFGLTCNYFDDYEKAIYHFRNSISLGIEEYGKTSKRVGLLIDLLGNSYYYLKDYPKAIQYFEETIEILKKEYNLNKVAIGNRYSKIGACYTNMRDFEAADKYMNRCFDVLGFDTTHEHPFESYKGLRTHLLIALYFKAKNHQKAYEAGRGTAQLYEASRWFELCIELIEYINSTFAESGSKQYLLDQFYYVFEAAINCKYHLYQETDSLQYLEQAFGFAERSKALLLKEAMWMADVALELGIPDGLLEEERRLKKAIIELENTRYERQQGQIGNVIHGINSEIFKLKEAYHKVMDSIQRRSPDSYRLQYAAGPITTGQVREELLAPGQALVQYFLGEETIFLFVINREGATLTKLPRGEGLDEAINGFRESIYGWSRFREDSLSRQYADYGYLLYQKLVQPVAHQLPEQLIIIPDGLLEYLPFEALLLEAVNPGALPYNAYPYFLRRHQVSYAHSAELLREMKTARHEADRRWVLAFAPSFNDPPEEEPNLALRRRNLGRLGSNVKEVQAIKRLWRTRIHKGQDATRERFLADAPYYSIIHLATHAKANDEEGEYSFLAFTEIPDTIQNELLYAKDLYSLRLKADMVVLSACETGVGELRRGEGVISLARGFSYAGAKSLATTLWRVSDRESAALMNLFYQQMKEGHPKDKALRNAKLQFISQSGPELAHPFFWAAFVLSGDMAPIEVSGRTFTNWGFAFLIGLFVFLGWRFAKNKPN